MPDMNEQPIHREWRQLFGGDPFHRVQIVPHPGRALQGRAVFDAGEWMWDPFGREEEPPQLPGKRGEELFQLILSGIREVYDVEATIAGGAVRDLAAGVQYTKDVDVFIPMKWKDFNERVAELGWQGPTALVKEGYKVEGCVVPSTARASSKVQNMPVDLIFMDKPLTKEVVDKFPIHAQRCVWTLADGLFTSPVAKTDIDNKTFTIDPTITDKDRIAKIETKVKGWLQRSGYKGWEVVLPEIKEWWENAPKKPE
jgi:hypothetical protein